MTDKSGRAGRLRAALWALLLACAGASAQQVKAPLGPVAPLDLKAPAAQAASLPADAASLEALPALPALPAAVAPLQPPSAAEISAPGAAAGLRVPLGELASIRPSRASPAAAGGASGGLDEIFDGRQPSNSNAPAVPAPAPEGPRLPPGLDHVVAGTVQSESDVWRLIPLRYSPNSMNLTRKLARNVEKMKPYDVYTYFDKRGGKIIAIDLSRKPDLIKLLPEQQSHEVRLIKKIQAWNLDLQVVVREEGATPDLIVGGMLTELKTRGGQKVELSQLLDKANGQVASHALRHGLGDGAAVIDLARRQDGVPMAEVALELESWRRATAAAGQAVALKKIYIFGGRELREFDRRPDGSFAPAQTAAMPFAPSGRPAARPAGPAPSARTALGDAFARRRIEQTVRHWMKKERYRSALRAWEDFSVSAGPEEALRARQRLGSLLDVAQARLDNPKPRTRRR